MMQRDYRGVTLSEERVAGNVFEESQTRYSIFGGSNFSGGLADPGRFGPSSIAGIGSNWIMVNTRESNAAV